MAKKLLGEIELNRIYQRDCIEGMRMIPDKSVDMILCDLPYGTTACKWDTVIPFEPLWEQYERTIKDRGAIVLTASQPFTSALVMSKPKLFRYEWIWVKNAGSNFSTVKYQPMKEHESVIVFGRQSPNYYPIKQPRSEAGRKMIQRGVKSKAVTGDYAYGDAHNGYDNSMQDPSMRVPSSVQKFNRERGLHPTQKPVDLFRYLIRTYTNPGEIVLDNCMGSGTTAVAATLEGRQWVGFETEPKYVTAANIRLDSLQVTEDALNASEGSVDA